MKQRIRSSLARCLAVLAAPVLVLGVMAGMAPASAASPLSHESGGRPQADAAPGVPASLRASIRKSLGTAGYSRQAELTASDGASNDESGFSVALSALGTTALVGAWMRHSSTGAAYVFSLHGRTWSQTAELTAPHGAPDDDFGISVALSALGTTAMVGAPRHSGPGEAYVFKLRGRTWSQTAMLTAAHGTRGDSFGWPVTLSAPGTTALVGASGVNTGTGAAYVFRLRGRTWSQTAELTAPHGTPEDVFGSSVAVSALGTTALVGDPGRNSNTGAAYVFRLRGRTWSRTAELTAPAPVPGDDFGLSVGLSALGSTALAGAPGRNTETGAAYVFRLRGRTWSQAAELTAATESPRGEFGYSVALSAQGSTVLGGAPYANSAAGAAYVFRLRGRNWSQAAELTAAHAATPDQFGFSVALSALGSTALAGAPGINSYAGAAYVLTGRSRP